MIFEHKPIMPLQCIEGLDIKPDGVYVDATLGGGGHSHLIGEKLSEKYGVDYLYSDFKKKNGYKRSVELSAEYRLYRQNLSPP